MKKTFAFLFVSFMAALPAFCASTCETRVDKHPGASTRDRVAYCLNPEKADPLPAGPDLVYYSVTSNKPAPVKDEKTPARKTAYFNPDEVAVSQDYMDTKKFPSFTNDALSEQEKLALEKALQAQAEEQAKLVASAEHARRLAQNTALTQPSVLAEEDAKGLSARQTKAKRFMKTPAETQHEGGYTDLESASAGIQPQSGYMEPTGTPGYEVQQAQSYQNDPLLQPTGNAGGAAPDGFLDDDLLTGESYGYEATDPAYQP